jgi:Glycosyltransferase family 9 (heptosyltransferase)
VLIFYVSEPLDVTLDYLIVSGYDAITISPASSESPVASSRPRDSRAPVRLRLESPGETGVELHHLYLTNSPRFMRMLGNYCSSRRTEAATGVVKLLGHDAQERLLTHPHMPKQLGDVSGRDQLEERLDDQLAGLALRHGGRFAFMNAFHAKFGDTLLGLRVLAELRDAMVARIGPVTIDLLQAPVDPEIDDLYVRSGLVASIRPLPMSLAEFARYDGFFRVGTRRLTDDKHWADQAFRSVGLDPKGIPRSRKHVMVPPLPPIRTELRHAVEAARMLGRPVLLFQSVASNERRTCPPHHAVALAQRLLEQTNFTVASAKPLALAHDRFADWSPVSRSFDDFTYLVSQADVLLTVDTCAYHLADAFGVPAVVLFATERPESRITYHPYAEGIALETLARAMTAPKIAGELVPDPERDWSNLRFDRVLAALYRVLQKRYESTANHFYSGGARVTFLAAVQ